MSNDFINPTEKKIILINKKKSEVCKNLPNEDLSKRRTLESINYRLLNSYIESAKKAKSVEVKLYFLSLIRKLDKEIKDDLKNKLKQRKNEEISSERNNNLTSKIKKKEIKKEISKQQQIISNNNAIPFSSGLTKEFVEKNWHLVRPCDPNEPLIKKPKKKSGSFFISNAYKYY
jgi:hypothetical protein